MFIFSRSYFTTNYKIIGIANAFSGGIFLSVALLHLLPESTEIFHEFFNSKNQGDDAKQKKFPISFLLCFLGYTFILMLEKVICDSHSHVDKNSQENNNEKEFEKDYENKIVFENKIENDNVAHNNKLSEKDYYRMEKNSLHQIDEESPNINFTGIYHKLTFTDDSDKKPFTEESVKSKESFSLYSVSRNDRITNYLQTFKVEGEKEKEEHFKNLFSTAGKISTALTERSRSKFFHNFIFK